MRALHKDARFSLAGGADIWLHKRMVHGYNRWAPETHFERFYSFVLSTFPPWLEPWLPWNWVSLRSVASVCLRLLGQRQFH